MSGGQVYSVDTSALIDGMERFYPRRNFPALWERIDLLIDDGRMHISEEAWSEATSVDAPVREWCEEGRRARAQRLRNHGSSCGGRWTDRRAVPELGQAGPEERC
ncbi:DUF4411 family protein [Curtobacterium sp. VKM Ac-2887]|uniref:DUF4411 family protein n=1 Tax=Curtobacterium sp. VKM Ac-2887 TaxID=2783819 RepID=UPI002B27B965|nr:DUF4411 family protein [Curtobacterium sp. VKM Ac-2887]